MTALKDTFTSTGAKFFHHQQTMHDLRAGKGRPVVTHVMLTDVCNHTCAFCSVQHRAGDSLAFVDVMVYLETLKGYGLKAVILSGGGNPILYRDRATGKDFNDVVDYCFGMGLEIGCITNGMPLKTYVRLDGNYASWKTVKPETLDKLTWVRISMSGLDHDERVVYVPDVNPDKTALGFSWVAHDIFWEPADKAHGKVSTAGDLITPDRTGLKTWTFEERIPELIEQFTRYIKRHQPRYLRTLPNCLEPAKIPQRCEQLQEMCDEVNREVGYECCFVQNKPPQAPKNCWLGYIHPVLSTDGYVYPCDSVTLAVADVAYKEGKSDHRFASPWRICHAREIAKLYEQPIRSLVDSQRLCQGCVFHRQNEILEGVVTGTTSPVPPSEVPEHANFL